MFKPLAGVLLAAVMLSAQTTPSASVPLPASEEKAIVSAIADFYKANSQYRDRMDALTKERTEVLNAQRQKIEALRDAIQKAHSCTFDLDTYLCSTPSPKKSPQ